MIICVCNNVNEQTIMDTIEENRVQTIESLQQKIAVCNQCCQCQSYIINLISLLSDPAI